jgi:hypothetical protein
VHFRGSAYPSSPGLTFKFGMVLLHDRHWMEIRVVFALIPEAEMMTPEIFTRRETMSDLRSRMFVGLALDAITI